MPSPPPPPPPPKSARETQVYVDGLDGFIATTLSAETIADGMRKAAEILSREPRSVDPMIFVKLPTAAGNEYAVRADRIIAVRGALE